MKKIMMLSVFAIIALISACKESTVLPYDGDELKLQKANLLTDDYWIIISTTDPEIYLPCITKFQHDGKATERQFAPELTKNLNWDFSTSADSITITTNNIPQKYKIDTLTNNRFVISYSHDGIPVRVEYYKVDKDYKYAIAGSIENRCNCLLDNNMKVECAWFGGVPLGEAIRIYGKGSINPDESTFFIGFDNIVPDSTCLLNVDESFANFKLALGYIFLFKQELPLGYYANLLDKTKLVENNYHGVIQNRSIIMKYGTNGTVLFHGKEAPWVNNFASGWSMAEAVDATEKATWKISYPYDLILMIDHINSVSIPVWL